MPPSTRNNKGFTLVELMVAAAVSGMVIVSIWTVYRLQKRTMEAQEVVTDIQQNNRAALLLVPRDIRRAGYDPTASGRFGITVAGFQSVDLNNDGALDPLWETNSIITLNADNDGDDTVDPTDENGALDANEPITFSLYQFGADVANSGANATPPDLGRTAGLGGQQLLAQNIEKMELAYAYDANSDGQLDTYTTTAAGTLPAGSQQVIWAIDTNNDGTLETMLDTNGDGDITRTDGPTASATGVVNERIAGLAIGSPGTLADIRAVRIWFLAAEDAYEQGEHRDQFTYAVGRTIVTPQDNRRRRLVETVVACKNMGLR